MNKSGSGKKIPSENRLYVWRRGWLVKWWRWCGGLSMLLASLH